MPQSSSISIAGHIRQLLYNVISGGGVTPHPEMLKPAFIGDSQSVAGTLVILYRLIYITFLKAFLGERFNVERNIGGSAFSFATGGVNTNSAQMIANVAGAGASDADWIFVLPGTNDAINANPVGTFISQVQSIIVDPLLADGKKVILLATLPFPQGATGNSAWVKSDLVASYQVALQNLANQYGDDVRFINVCPSIETAPGRAIASYMASDTDVHLAPLGAEVFGRALAVVISALFELTVDPEDGRTILTPNADFASGTTRPTGYSFFASNMSAGESIITDGDGTKWWRLNITASTADGFGLIWNDTATPSPAGLLCGSEMRVRVASGKFFTSQHSLQNQSSTARTTTMDGTNDRHGGFVASDGVMRITPQAVVMDGGDTLARIQSYFRAEAGTVVDIQFEAFSIA